MMIARLITEFPWSMLMQPWEVTQMLAGRSMGGPHVESPAFTEAYTGWRLYGIGHMCKRNEDL
ncbi:unnamed protein product [Clonostachys rosea f. rosea IK726]|uniref:Uncharacterized protein n=1 Tax=Clonostachys rosea f. rosea IK726 TaxID=1349383 RepID=A0ACA9U8K9_BIOOC|nr:unnamed protein product [Clonostachys rosea f. rosea IK726]